MPGGGRIYYSQFKERMTKTALGKIAHLHNPILFAAKSGDEGFLQLLLGYGHVNATTKGKTALFHAIETMNTELLKKIFDGGGEPTNDDFHLTAALLHKATQENDISTATFICDLIKEGRFHSTSNPILK